MMIPATFRTPFDLGPQSVRRFTPGMTLMDMAQAMDLPTEWWQPGRGVIDVDGMLVPRALWGAVRPKASVSEIRFLFALHGGGGDDGKNPLALVASIALLGATGFIAGGGLATKFGLTAFAETTFAANAAAALVGVAGQAIIGSMMGGQSRAGVNSEGAEAPNSASIEGNVLQPEGGVVRVMGTRKVFPPLACEPLTYFDGQDEVSEAVYVMAGPHAISDIRLGGAPVADMRGVEIEAHEGWPGGPRGALVTRQSKTDQVGEDLRGHTLREDGVTVNDEADGGWEPQPYVVATREQPDEIWLPINFAQGLSIGGGVSQNIRVPFRVRVRQIGATDWVNLPEIHFADAQVKPIRATIKLIWQASPDEQVAAAAQVGWVEAFKSVPDQAVAPVGGGWAAHSSFDTGTGDDNLTAQNYETTGVRNVQMVGYEARFYLDTASFPKGAYEVEVTRGLTITDPVFNGEAYTVSGSVWPLFGARGTGALGVAQGQKDRVATVVLVAAANIWNQHPVPTDKFATISLRVRNRQAGQLSCVASGYVRDWDGAAWETWTTTSNPAPHFRDVMRNSAFNSDPVPEAVIDEDDLVAWRAECAAKGYQINAMVEGGTVGETLARVAAAGFALPRMADEWGVVRGRDTSADVPVQMFTPRNARDITVSKVFSKPPAGIRASWRDKDQAYRENELIEPPTAVGGRLLAIDYPDHVTRAEVLRQVRYDLAELLLRTVTVDFTAGAEALACRRGDLIALQHDMLDRHAGAARVVDWAVDGDGDVTEIRLDGSVPVVNEPDWFAINDFFAVDDVLAVGQVTAVALRGDDGLTVARLSNATGEATTLTLATPASGTGIHVDALCAVGPVEQVTARMIVTNIRRRGRFDAQVTCVDEQPSLFADH